MNTLQHKQVKSQKKHLQILWGRATEVPRAKKNKYPLKRLFEKSVRFIP